MLRAKMRKRLRFLLFEAHTSALELFLSLVCIALGLWFGNPVFTAFASSASYHLMAEVMPEEGWAFLLVVVGLSDILGLVLQNRRWRMAGLVASTFLWLLMALCFLISNYTAAGGLLFTMNALGCFLCLMRPEMPRDA